MGKLVCWGWRSCFLGLGNWIKPPDLCVGHICVEFMSIFSGPNKSSVSLISLQNKLQRLLGEKITPKSFRSSFARVNGEECA